jgi:hypothetical protein
MVEKVIFNFIFHSCINVYVINFFVHIFFRALYFTQYNLLRLIKLYFIILFSIGDLIEVIERLLNIYMTSQDTDYTKSNQPGYLKLVIEH